MSTVIRHAITILREPEQVYAFFRDFQNLAEASRHIVSIRELSPGRTEWTVKGPTGDVCWESETIREIEGQELAWKSVEGADVSSRGLVTFTLAPLNQGTEVHVNLAYDPPAGKLGEWVATLTGTEPRQEVAETLRRMKAILECGSIPVVEGQPSSIMRGDSQSAEETPLVGLR